MRYLLDTCIVLYMLNETGEMSNDVEDQTFVNLRWNLAAKHTDTSDHLIIAHAITEHLPLISSDGKFDFYCKQGLNFIFNKKK
jgi:PIN domain nuclease of toxin-antitoxin system